MVIGTLIISSICYLCLAWIALLGRRWLTGRERELIHLSSSVTITKQSCQELKHRKRWYSVIFTATAWRLTELEDYFSPSCRGVKCTGQHQHSVDWLRAFTTGLMSRLLNHIHFVDHELADCHRQSSVSRLLPTLSLCVISHVSATLALTVQHFPSLADIVIGCATFLISLTLSLTVKHFSSLTCIGIDRASFLISQRPIMKVNSKESLASLVFRDLTPSACRLTY